MTLQAAAAYGCEVDTLTLSVEQKTLTEERVRAFVLSLAHSDGVSRRERIRRELRRWHPDKFGRYMGAVRDDERERVAEAAGLVVRALNALVAKENEKH